MQAAAWEKRRQIDNLSAKTLPMARSFDGFVTSL
jgi:hypothetical protein